MSNMSFMKAVAAFFVVSVMSMVGFTVSANASDIDEWQKDVGNAIAKKQSYPREALRKSIEGQLKVEIDVDRDGNIVAHNVVTSSGHEVLDREVPKLMSRVSPLPAPPAGVPESELKMVVPLAWAIQ